MSERLLLLTDPGSSESGGKMSEWTAELIDWLQPMRKASLAITPEHLEQLIQQLKHYSDDILELPKGLVTVLRVMYHLAVAPTTHSSEGMIA